MRPTPSFALAPLALLVLAASPPTEARACARPPWVACDLVPEVAVARHGDSLSVFVTLTNLSPGNPPLNDLPFRVSLAAAGATGPRCAFSEPGPPDAVEPSERVVVLDDAQSSLADGPTSWTGSFEVELLAPANQHLLVVSACGDADGDGRCERYCEARTCIPTTDEPGELAHPDANFETPARCVKPGERVPFVVHARRNGYPAGRPLRVQLVPGNPNDPTDIFPIEPPEILTIGAEMLGDEATFEPSCSVHGPCFAGVTNSYEIRILDEDRVVWDSAWTRDPESTGALGLVRVCDVPVGLSSRQPAGESVFSPCDGGLVHLRVIARNPSLDAGLEDVSIEQGLPAGLSVVEHSLHYHDNPLDAVDPTPAELAAPGRVDVLADRVVATTPRVEPRFERGGPPVTMFRDLCELDLVVDVPASAVAGRDELVFPGALVRGRLGGRELELRTDPVRIDLGSAPPGEVSGRGAPRPLTVEGAEGLVSWDAAGHERFDLFRGELSELSATNYGRCRWSGLTESRQADASPPPPGDGWFYLARAVDCELGGSAGTDSFARPRELRDACR